ncbi:pectate lyase [Belliella marina]|uniref:Pectate lyase n=1 Tax=Belliella marina TaxID=1644146 RepID=A0ABW4VJ88_9BACT
MKTYNRSKWQLIMFSLVCSFAFTIYGCDQSVADPDIKDEEEEPYDGPFDAFPGAEGFAREITGGRGGKVYKVTKLSDDGTEGTLRHAVESSGKRYVVFAVSGNIELTKNLHIRNGDITIAGQTAPGGGITLKNYSMLLSSDNIIIRFLRFRMGDTGAQEADAIEGRYVKNIMIDHCSMSWSTDETATFYANETFTMQWCIISESLRNSVHEKGAHGYAGNWGGKFATFHHNLIAHHDSRNPRLGEGSGSAFALESLTDLRNNVIYNWGNNSAYGGEAMNVNIVNCYYKPGPASPSGSKRNRIMSIDKNRNEGTDIYDIWGKFYINGNVVEGSSQTSQDNWTYGVYNQFHGSYGVVSEEDKLAMRVNEAHDIEDNTTTHSAQEAYEKVLEYAGASLSRDAVDERVVNEAKNGTFSAHGSRGSTNGIIDSQEDVGGWPELEYSPTLLDSDGDGMPDDWELANGLDPHKYDPNGKDLNRFYDNIEVYINSLVQGIVDNQN